MLIQEIRTRSNVLVKALKKLTIGLGPTERSHDLLNSELLIPLELILQILSYLNTPDILKCRMVSRQLRFLVDTAHELQYPIELTAASFADNAVNVSSYMSLSGRLTALRNAQTFWKQPRFQPGCVIPLEALNFAYHGNVFVMPRRTRDLSDIRLLNTFHCVALESSAASITTREWTLDFDFGFEAFAVDPSHDRLALLDWRKRTEDTHNEWIFAINIVSLRDGRPVSNGETHMPAHRRDFAESPSMAIQGDLMCIVGGGLHGDVSDQNRNIYVTIVNMSTGALHARLTRCCEHGLEYTSRTLVFASSTCFLLAVKQDGHFSIEVYSLEDDVITDRSDVITPTHVATYQFPPLEKGASSTGVWNALSVGRSGGLDPAPSVPATGSTIINLNRLYYGPTDSIRTSCYVQLSTFLSALELYRRRKDGSNPLFLPWSMWGPAYTRCFDDSQSRAVHIVPKGAYGSRVYEDGCIRDFNQREIARELGTSTLPSRLAFKGTGFATRGPLKKSRTAGSTSHKDHKVPGYPGRIVQQPTVIPAGNVFVDDVTTMLPYRETEITWEGEEPKVVLSGEVWVGGFPRKDTAEAGNSTLVYRALIPRQ